MGDQQVGSWSDITDSGSVPSAQSTPASQPVAGSWADIDSNTAPVQPAAPTPAAQPGAYQQSPGGAIQNANQDAKAFDNGGQLQQRPDESAQQFIQRGVEAGKNVTQPQIDAEEKSDAKQVPAALAVGPVMAGAQLTGVLGGAALIDGLTAATGGTVTKQVATGLVDQFGEPIMREITEAAPKVGTNVAANALKWMGENKAKTMMIMWGAKEFGIPMAKILTHMAKLGD